MAGIGAKLALVAKIKDGHKSGEPLEYEEPKELGATIETTITPEYRDNQQFANDIAVESDNGISGGTIRATVAHANLETEAYVLGYDVKEDGGYIVTDDASPYIGYGTLQVLLYRNTYSYKGYFVKKAQLRKASYDLRTKEKEISYQSAGFDGRFFDADDNAETNKARFFEIEEFNKFSDAKAWLYEKFGAAAPQTAETEEV